MGAAFISLPPNVSHYQKVVKPVTLVVFVVGNILQNFSTQLSRLAHPPARGF